MQNTVTVSPPQTFQSTRQVPWWEKAIALIAVINLFLGLFNLTYVSLRDVYLRFTPTLVSTYDPVKGIEPHPFIKEYLHTVDLLNLELSQHEEFTPAAEQLLATLRSESEDLIEENPFLASSKFGTFARIQRQIRQHMGTQSAQPALEKFWNSDHLKSIGWETEFNFFNSNMRPLLERAYYRNVDDYGQFIDNFWRVDVYFNIFFVAEYLTRTLIISRRQAGVNWLDAMLRRWYDIFLFLPFWRWLRILPVTVRIHTSKLFNLEWVITQLTHEPAAYLSDRVSQFVLVRLLNQAKTSVEQGEAARALFNPQSYARVSEINKIEVITDRLLSLTIFKVLPQVQPDIEELLHYSLKGAFQASGFYENLQHVPGLRNLPANLVDELSVQLARRSVEILVASYSDEEGKKLFEQLSKDFNRALRLELQDEETLAELEALISELLEELKINYVTKSVESDPTQTMEEVDQIVQSRRDSLERETQSQRQAPRLDHRD